MGDAVVALDSEKKVLHFPQGTAIHGRGEVLHRAGELRFASAKETRNECRTPLRRRDFPLRGNGHLQIANALVGLLQPDRLAGLGIP